VNHRVRPTGSGAVEPRAYYVRVKRRRGHKCATVSPAHSTPVSGYHVLDEGVPYQELGGDLARRDPERQTKRLVAQLERLGHPRHAGGRVAALSVIFP
jgi:hypothetical protein